jgi:hypothetical protein
VSGSSTISARRRRPARKPVNLGVGGAILLVPILMMAAVVSIPYAWARRTLVKRKELRFKRRMKSMARLKTWNDVESCLADKTATFVVESLSMKGPSRLWWTPDRISEISPFPFVSSDNRDRLCYEMEFRPFGNWCFHRYTSPRSGKAFLVEIPVEQSKEIWKRVTTAGCISTYSRKARTA